MLAHHHTTAVAVALALVSSAAGAQCSTTLTWTPPTQNTDGSPLTDLLSYRAYWGSAQGNYPFSETFPAPASSRFIGGPLAAGVNYLVLTAIDAGGNQSVYSNVATKDCGGAQPKPPGPVLNPSVVPVAPAALTVTLSNLQADNSPEFTLAITGSGPVTIALGADHVFDWCTAGAPQLGGNGGTTAKSVTFQAPLSTRCDADGAQPFAGGMVTFSGVSKPLALVGETWSVSFP